MTTSSTPMATAVAAAVAGGSAQPAGTGANGSADGASSGGGFTALLAAALGTGDPAAVVEALQGLHRGGAGESDTSDTADEAPVAGLQQALAALLPRVSAGTTSGAGTDGADAEAAAIVRAGAEETLDRAALLAALRAATAAGRAAVPTTTGQAAGATSVPTTPDAPPTTTAPTPTTGTAASASASGHAVPMVPGSTERVASTLPSSPGAAPTRGPAASLDVTAPTETSTPTPLPPAGTSGGAATGANAAQQAAPAPAATPVDGGLHARVVARVIQAAELLENAPPPRHMVVEVPDSDGLRLQVAMRGSEVHVALQAGRTAPDLGAWGRELAAGLASRGMSLGEFTSGDSTPSGRDQQPSDHHHPRPSEDDRAAAPPRGRSGSDDGELRL